MIKWIDLIAILYVMSWFRSFRALMIISPQQDVNIFDTYVIMHDRVDSGLLSFKFWIMHAFHWYQIP